ncbi:hypothetical protein DICVIV_05374 [Dictyocaulus viviparus]|uniref:Apple domain-containing protein n=1 Tax=Dictyocaulus viviparus TaxID=29172 RepID=A0A0D8XXM9_DICVI|nr:hypothetical protein DICVIV_05374 [Dictyocaulus viviparus]
MRRRCRLDSWINPSSRTSSTTFGVLQNDDVFFFYHLHVDDRRLHSYHHSTTKSTSKLEQFNVLICFIDHFGDPCYLCRCFVEYTDRDVTVSYEPYAMAVDGYDTTEDRCLATCRRDERCHAAVYGMIGGRSVFTCEFYEKIDSKNSPFYVPYVNIYIKKAECSLRDDHLPSVKMIVADDSSLRRRIRFGELAKRPNPFEG